MPHLRWFMQSWCSGLCLKWKQWASTSSFAELSWVYPSGDSDKGFQGECQSFLWVFPTGRIPRSLTHPSPTCAQAPGLQPASGGASANVQWFRTGLILAVSGSFLVVSVSFFLCKPLLSTSPALCSESSSLPAGPKRQSSLILALGLLWWATGEDQGESKEAATFSKYLWSRP